ncbi:MGMT family protein [Cupriavidus basilensis]
MRESPFGETTSLWRTRCAGSGSRPPRARAVGSAVGRNPLSVIVPCHRVLGAGGDLTDAPAVPTASALLRLEGTAAAMALPILRQSGVGALSEREHGASAAAQVGERIPSARLFVAIEIPQALANALLRVAAWRVSGRRRWTRSTSRCISSASRTKPWRSAHRAGAGDGVMRGHFALTVERAGYFSRAGAQTRAVGRVGVQPRRCAG